MKLIKFNRYLGKKYTLIYYENGDYLWSIPYDNLEDIKIEGFRLKTLDHEPNGRNKRDDTKEIKRG